MSGDVALRLARPDDAIAVAAIYAHHVRHGTASFDMEPATEDEMRKKIALCAERGWPFLVAERGETVVGYANATQFRERAAYAFTCENSVYVRADAIGSGIGRRLLAELMARAEAAGFRQMIAVIGDGEPASVALHMRAGFRETGRMGAVGRKFGRWLDTVYMQRALGPGDAIDPEPRGRGGT